MKVFTRISGAAAAGVALFAMSGPASAALIFEGTEFSSSVTGSGSIYDLTMTMDFTNAYAGGQFIGDMMEAWSLLLPGAATVTLTAAPAPLAGWSIQNHAQSDASGCGNGAANAICVDWGTLNVLNGGGPVIDVGDIFTFTVHVVFAADTAFTSDSGNFHLLSVRSTTSGCPGGRTAGPCIKKDGGLISLPLEPGDDDDDDTDLPEPGTLGLLGLGLLGVGLSRRRKA